MLLLLLLTLPMLCYSAQNVPMNSTTCPRCHDLTEQSDREQILSDRSMVASEPSVDQRDPLILQVEIIVCEHRLQRFVVLFHRMSSSSCLFQQRTEMTRSWGIKSKTPYDKSHVHETSTAVGVGKVADCQLWITVFRAEKQHP